MAIKSTEQVRENDGKLRVDLGTLSWTYDSSSADRKYFYAPLSSSKSNGVCYTKKIYI